MRLELPAEHSSFVIEGISAAVLRAENDIGGLHRINIYLANNVPRIIPPGLLLFLLVKSHTIVVKSKDFPVPTYRPAVLIEYIHLAISRPNDNPRRNIFLSQGQFVCRWVAYDYGSNPGLGSYYTLPPALALTGKQMQPAITRGASNLNLTIVINICGAYTEYPVFGLVVPYSGDYAKPKPEG